jgi:hypothetical protein
MKAYKTENSKVVPPNKREHSTSNRERCLRSTKKSLRRSVKEYLKNYDEDL